eukprot:g10414.t1
MANSSAMPAQGRSASLSDAQNAAALQQLKQDMKENLGELKAYRVNKNQFFDFAKTATMIQDVQLITAADLARMEDTDLNPLRAAGHVQTLYMYTVKGSWVTSEGRCEGNLDDPSAGGGIVGDGSPASNSSEFLIPPPTDSAAPGVADFEQQKEHVASWFRNARAATKWQSRIYSKVTPLVHDFYRQVSPVLAGSVCATHSTFRIECDATPLGHRTDRKWGQSIDRSAKAMLVAFDVSWLISAAGTALDEDHATRNARAAEWVTFELPVDARLLTSSKEDQQTETEMVFDILASVPGLREMLSSATRPVELLVAFDSASSNIGAAHLFGAWVEELNPNAVVVFRPCALHGLNKTISDSAALLCTSLGFELAAVEKRMHLTARLYGKQANCINEAVDTVARAGRVVAADHSALDPDALAAYRHMVSMLELFDGKNQCEVFPDSGAVHVLASDDDCDTELLQGCEKFLDRGASSFHRVFSKPCTPSLTRFATAAKAAGEQWLMWFFQKSVGGSLSWDEWKRSWASPHIGDGDRFDFADGEEEYRTLCACIALVAYPGNRLQKRVMAKSNRESWAEMAAKYERDIQEVLTLIAGAGVWRLLNVDEGTAELLKTVIGAALRAQFSMTTDEIFLRYSYDRLMNDLHTSSCSDWRTILNRHANALEDGPVLYSDVTQRSVLRLKKMADDLDDCAAVEMLGGFVLSWLKQSRSTLRVEQLRARYQSYMRGIFWKGVSDCSQYLVRSSIHAAKRLAASSQWVESIIPAPKLKRGIDVYVSNTFEVNGLSGWKQWSEELKDSDRKHYASLAKKMHAEAMERHRTAEAERTRNEKAKEFDYISADYRAEFYGALAKFVETHWRQIAAEAAYAERKNYCERRVPRQTPGSVKVRGDISTGIRRRIGQLAKNLAPAKEGLAACSAAPANGLQQDDEHAEIFHEAPASPVAVQSAARLFLVEYEHGDSNGGGIGLGATLAPTRAFLVTSVALNPYNFWGTALEQQGDSSWKLPGKVSADSVVSGSTLANVQGERVYVAGLVGGKVLKVGGRLQVNEKKKPEPEAGPINTLGNVAGPSLALQACPEWEAVMNEDDPEKLLERMEALRHARDKHEDSTKRRKVESPAADEVARPGLEFVRAAVSCSSSSSSSSASRVKVADRVTVLVLSDAEREQMNKDRLAERMAASVPAYRIKSGDSKYTEKMIEKGAKKKESKKRVIEPRQKIDMRPLSKVKWLFDVLGKKSLECSITSAADADDVRHTLNLWAARHAYVFSCVRGEKVEDLEVRGEDAEAGRHVVAQWESILAAWSLENTRTPGDKVLKKKIEEFSKIPTAVANRLRPLASEEEEVFNHPVAAEDEEAAQPGAGSSSSSASRKPKNRLALDEEDDLLASSVAFDGKLASRVSEAATWVPQRLSMGASK